MIRITDFGKEGDPQFLVRPEINVKPIWIPDVPFIRHSLLYFLLAHQLAGGRHLGVGT